MNARELIRRLIFLLHRDRYADDLEAEMEFHREMRASKYERLGMDHAEAVYAASRQFGNQTLIKETSAGMWGWSWIDDLVRDVRHTLRLFAANPLFSVVAVLTLALGIGANTAIFSVTHAILFRALPVPDAHQLFYIHVDPGQPSGASNTGNSNSSFSAHVFERLRRQGGSAVNVMAYVPLAIGKTGVRAGSEPEPATVVMVSGNFFSGIGLSTICGRALNVADEQTHSALAVLSYGFWSSRFNSDCSVIGRRIYIKGVPFTIAGVLQKSFTGIEANAVDVWIPLQDRRDLNAWGSQREHFYADPNWWCLKLIARLAPGVTPAKAISLLEPGFFQAAYEHLGGKPVAGEKPRRLSFVPAVGVGQPSPELKAALYVLLAMVGVILVIACGNVAMLLAARNSARQREFSIRMAIGGSRGRLFRQLLAESSLLVLSGAALGWILANFGTSVLGRWAAIEVSLSPDGAVLLFTLGIAAIAALAFGVAPLFAISNTPVAQTLKSSAATAFRQRLSARNGRSMVAGQVALCLVLLVAAGLFVRTLRNLERENLGFRTNGLLVFGLNPQLGQGSDAEAIRFYEGLLQKLRALPGVESVTLMGNRPGSGWSNNTTAVVDGRDPRSEGFRGSAGMRWNNVGPHFFTTLGIPLLLGRDFTEADSGAAPRVAVVNETFVRRFLQDRQPLGHQVSYTRKFAFTIVGVAANSKYTGVRERDVPMAWFPYTQVGHIGALHVELRIGGNADAFWPVLRRSVAQYAPDLPLLEPANQQSAFDGSLSQERLLANLAVGFGALAVVLVATGLYGVLTYSVRRRTAELGIRMAIGAQRSDLLWMIVRESLLICVIGAAVGLPVTLALTHGVGSLLYGLAPHDPLTFCLGIIGIAVVTVAASLAPAVRAASMDPLHALRYE